MYAIKKYWTHTKKPLYFPPVIRFNHHQPDSLNLEKSALRLTTVIGCEKIL